MLGVLKRITPSLSTKASLSSGLLLILDFIYQYLLQCARRIWKARPKHWMCLCNVVQDSILLTSVVIYGLCTMCAEYSEIKVVFWVILSSWRTCLYMQTLTEATETFQVLEGKAEFKLHIQIPVLIFYLTFAKLGLKNWLKYPRTSSHTIICAFWISDFRTTSGHRFHPWQMLL